MRLFTTAIACLLSLSLSSTARAEREVEPPPPASEEAHQAAQANTQFTLDLYRRLAAQNNDNLFMSGYSVMSALMLLSDGTTGPAANELGEALYIPQSAFTGDTAHPWQFSDFSAACAALEDVMSPGDPNATAAVRRQLSELEDRWAALRRRIENSNQNEQFELIRQEQELVNQINALRQQIDPYQLRFANALWCDTSFPLRDDFLASVEANWGALAFPCDFVGDAESEREKINAWVAEQTNDLITDLLSPGTVDAATRLILTNAVYFKGNWEEPFEPSSTQEQPFILASGDSAPTMLMADWYRWANYVELTPEGAVNDYVSIPAPADSPFENAWELPANPGGFKLLELPYRGGQMSMIVILPNRPDGLADIEAALTHETLAEWKGKLAGQEVNVALPRFTMRNTLMLGAPLSDMGLNAIFQPGSLLGVSDSPEAEALFVGMIVQQAFVEVNEEGTEAAAATAILTPSSAAFAPKPTSEFRADHPFLYYIQDRETGAIVFMGRMTTPEG